MNWRDNELAQGDHELGGHQLFCGFNFVEEMLNFDRVFFVICSINTLASKTNSTKSFYKSNTRGRCSAFLPPPHIDALAKVSPGIS